MEFAERQNFSLVQGGPSVGMAASVIADGRYAEVILKQIDGADRLYFYRELGISERLFWWRKGRYDLKKLNTTMNFGISY